MRRIAVLFTAAGLALGACAPTAPKGVDKEKLDEAIASAIGDPSTCVLIAEQDSGRRVYRYNSHGACDRQLPACNQSGTRRLDDLLKDTLKDGQPRALSCNTEIDASRGVGWASGVINGRNGPLVYAALMEGDRAFPGRMMAERLARAFGKAGL